MCEGLVLCNGSWLRLLLAGCTYVVLFPEKLHLLVLVTTAETVKVWYDVAVAYAVETKVVG